LGLGLGSILLTVMTGATRRLVQMVALRRLATTDNCTERVPEQSSRS
jgi:hypothetical protein